MVLRSGEQSEWLRFKVKRDFPLIIDVYTKQRSLILRQYFDPMVRVVYELSGRDNEAGERYEDVSLESMDEVGFHH